MSDTTDQRLECLKLSYNINSKIGNIKNSYATEKEIHDDLLDVFSLSDILLDYVIYAKRPEYWFDSEEE